MNERPLTPRERKELRWLEFMGIKRDPNVPLYADQPKTGGKYTP